MTHKKMGVDLSPSIVAFGYQLGGLSELGYVAK